MSNTNDTPQSVQELLKKEFRAELANETKPGRGTTPEPGGKQDSKKKTDKTNEVLSLDPEGVIEVLDAGDKLVYLTDNGEIVEKVIAAGIVYTPPPRDSLPYLLANKDKVLEHIGEAFVGSAAGDNDLYTRLYDYHKSVSDLPDDLYYDLLVLWDIHTYLIDKIHFSPILYLYAVKERGKSRTGKGCVYVSRRGVFTETVREADIIRWGNDHKAALGFDVKDFPKKIFRANCDDLLLARFEKGAVSSRTLWPEKGAFKDTKVFNLFGPTIVMTNRPVDDILESRCISIDMKPSLKKFNAPVLPEAALDLKARLAAFRYQHRNTKLLDIDKPAQGRLGDILSALNNIVFTFFPDKVERFQKLIKTIVEQKKDEATDTFEAQVVDALIRAEGIVVKSFVSIDDVTGLFNQGKDDKFALDVRTIGKVLRGLGFSPRKSPEGAKRGIYYDPELVKRVGYQYGLIDMPETMSETSDKAENAPRIDTSDISDVNQDTRGIPTEDTERKLEQLGIDPNKTSEQLTSEELLKIFPGASIEELS